MKPKKVPIALNLPTIVALLIVFARHVVARMTGNPWFVTPNPPLAGVTQDIDALAASTVAAKSRTVGAVADRDVKQKVVEDDLMALKAYVSAIVSLNIANALVIIESAGMFPKRHTPRAVIPLAALMGAAPDDVLLRAKPVAKRAAYEWQYSADGGKTWVAAGITTVANTTLLGLTVGTTYLFRFRATVKKVTGDWSQTISFLAH